MCVTETAREFETEQEQEFKLSATLGVSRLLSGILGDNRSRLAPSLTCVVSHKRSKKVKRQMSIRPGDDSASESCLLAVIRLFFYNCFKFSAALLILSYVEENLQCN